MNALWPLWASALALLLLTLGGLLWPLLREPTEPTAANPDAPERLRQLYRIQRAELAREHQRLSLSDEDYAQAVDELERRLLEDLDTSAGLAPSAPSVSQGHWRKRIPAALLTLLLPIGALVLYLEVGDPRAAATVAMGQPDAHSNTGVDVEAMVARLEERLRQSPDNLEGWIVLARSREVLEEFDAATIAYQRAIELAAQQQVPSELRARLYADMADAMASAREGALDKHVQAALAASLKLDADQPKALALAGTAALREGDFANARRYWQRLLKLLEPDSDVALRVQSDLARLEPSKSMSQTQASEAKTQATEAHGTRVAGLAGTVRLDPALQDRVQPGDTVFIVARAPEVGRMPVAVLRLTVAQLPAQFTLDDQNAMSPDMPLSRFDELTIEARISRSGTAQRQPGQPISLLQTVRRGSGGLMLLIGAVEP